MHFSNTSGNATSSLSTRDNVDPIAELLSQLSGVRRSTGSNSSTSQLAHIQMQLQLERQQVRAARQQLERLPRRQNQSSSSGANHTGNATSNSHNNAATNSSEPSATSGQNKHHEFLLSKTLSEFTPEVDKQTAEQEKQGRLMYTHSVLLGSIRAGIQMGPNPGLSSLLPQLELMSLEASSDAQGVTNISVGNSNKRFELRMPMGRKQATPSSQIDLSIQSSPTPLTRTITIPPGSTNEDTDDTKKEVVTHTKSTPSKAKILLANKMANSTKPADIRAIRQMVAAQYRNRQKVLESGGSLPEVTKA